MSIPHTENWSTKRSIRAKKLGSTLLAAGTKAIAERSPSSSKTTTSILTEKDFPRLRAQWVEKYADVFGDIPLELPPMREINHMIPLIDEHKVIKYHLPKCPDAFRPELSHKVNRYVTAQWWVPKACPQALPMLCIPKHKTGKLRTPFDCRKRNDNTIKDITPFPD